MNLDFAALALDDAIHCYEAAEHELAGEFPGWQEQSFFVALGADGQLTIERTTHAAGASPCDADPSTWAFGAGALRYMR